MSQFGVGLELADATFTQHRWHKRLDRLRERILRLGVLVLLGAGAYFVTLWGLGFRLQDFKRRAA